MSMESTSGGASCRQRLSAAAAEVVDYRGRQGLSSAQELRSMLADALGADGVKCRADLEAMVAVATAAPGISAQARSERGIDDPHWRRSVAEATGLDDSQVAWAAGVWAEVLGARSTVSRPSTPTDPSPADDATRLPADLGPAAPPDAVGGDADADAGAGGAIGADAGVGGGATNAARRGLTVGLVAVAAVLVVALGAFLWLQRDEIDASSTTTSTSSSSTTAPTTTEAPIGTEWMSATKPTADEDQLLRQMPEMFIEADSCRPIADGEPDPLSVYPQGPDEASIECSYPGGAIIVYSLFSSDEVMRQFFQGRLDGRDMPPGFGQIGPVPPWNMTYSDDRERGSGSIFGYQRFGDGARSEVGFIREGMATYAYSYRLGTDYASYYQWWAEQFGGPAPPA